MKLCVLIIVAIAASSGSALAAPTAQEMYGQGKRAYDAGDYTAAVLAWEQSYALSHEPGLIFNLAQANRLLGDCARALVDYKRFIALDPKSAQRSLAADFIHELESTCTRTSSTSTVEQPQQPQRTLKVSGLVTSGAGFLAIVIGVAVGHHAATLGDEVSHACAIAPGAGCDWQAERGTDAAGRRDARSATRSTASASPRSSPARLCTTSEIAGARSSSRRVRVER
jgi:tetratricopeptide (TPR) repeat protein